ncbi:MAG TPA: polyprenyl synthetase family protein [Planctomycetota bacterium]|nr:polyprenyl synthetase family protein [Planctomycetota bacterium]HRR82421.1 polyprenyl synthetase family protein [Planctomycetota bacterium]HRT93101.1 polyprenyl synthetase family protein [Planctomycetota bacterium]
MAKPEAITHDAPAAPWARPTHDSVPATKAERERLLAAARRYVADEQLVPPLPLDELKGHALRVIARAASEPRFRDFVTVLVSNAAWGETLAGIPFERRLLLLPQCLRDKEHCQAEVDEFGLLCRHCGRCVIHDLQTEAERLGYVVLVAEGTTVVMSLIQEGKIEAVIGVGCLAGLERIFPYTEAAAVPGLAIPLLNDGCAYTSADLDWVWDTLQLTRADRTRRLDLDALRAEVEAWFEPEALAAVLGPAGTETERLAREWLGRAGKRWRPFLALCAYQARRDDPEAPTPADFRKIAVAVECFHKASLVHDDIEDDDPQRYGADTLHKAHGIPIALNVGDLLLGEGYRLIAACGAGDAQKAAMLAAAAGGHRSLCLGQGDELAWARAPKPLTTEQVLAIFRQKTAPAFEVALQLGALYAGASDGVWQVLHECSDALGVAYQVRDDMDDFFGSAAQAQNPGPSIILALAHERATGQARDLLDALWRVPSQVSRRLPELRSVLKALGVEEAARQMLASYKDEAVRSLRPVENASLKGLLRRVICKIFNEIQT